jgi:hypothetical protein
MAGSWILWKIDTRSKVCRTNFEKSVTTDLVKETIGRIADEQEREMEQPVIPLNAAATVEEDNDATQQSTSETDDSEGPRNDPHEDEIDLINESEEVTGSQVQVEEEEPRETGGQARPISTTRTGRSIIRPSRFLAVTKVARTEWKNEAADKAIKAEQSMLFNRNGWKRYFSSHTVFDRSN